MSLGHGNSTSGAAMLKPKRPLEQRESTEIDAERVSVPRQTTKSLSRNFA